ncbi:P-loop containing nucleoside triphosphate hydrolase protein [Mycena filopes]|nr:P-loop containing nucleoside triphosphate hydrolase protein [Mycena filopes]
MTTLYPPGTRVYLDDSERGWVPAEVASCTKGAADTLTLVLKDEDGKVHRNEQQLPFIGAHKLKGIDHYRLWALTDLATLSHLNEPSILYAVETRYAQRKIYTYSGIVLLAVNPFEPVPMYTPDIVKAYIGRTKGELEPHLFAIAEESYAAMALDGTGQTIIVSGESGAGKTESAKLVMRFIAAPKSPALNSDKNSFVDGASQVEQQIQATNPILEAFGNAKTTRNDNSSRFGKYIQLLFDTNRQIVGARNVHDFPFNRKRREITTYSIQLCAGLPTQQLHDLGLDSDYGTFHYLNQGGPSTTELSDRDKFHATQEALGVIGIDDARQTSIFQVLAALLHLGNISVTQTRTDAMIDDEDPSMLRAMEFLGVDASEFKKWTIKKQITTRSEKIVTTLTAPQAVGWLVTAINESLTGKYGDAAARAETYIGVLDIYGFEHFETNSFEQFCINYANERLQHEFNTYVFKLAQEDYRLHHSCKSSTRSSTSQANKAVYKMPKFANAAFTIAHYALDVTYQVDGFLEKNRIQFQRSSSHCSRRPVTQFLREVFDTALHRVGRAGLVGTGRGTSVKKATLGSIFKSSLGTLMDMLRMTNVHYIRCLKPNQHKMAWEFSPLQVLAQLESCGCTRNDPDQYFALVYWRDGPRLLKGGKFKQLCLQILQRAGMDKTKYQFGETKIFLRTGVLATLESLRSAKLNSVVYSVSSRTGEVRWRGNAFKEVRQKARREAEAVKAKKAAEAVAERERKRKAKEASKAASANDKVSSEHGSPGKTKIRRMFSFGSKEKSALALPDQSSPEPPLIGRRPSRLEAATKRLSRSWYDSDGSTSTSAARKSPNHLAPPASGLPVGSSSSRVATPIYEQFMKKPAWNASTSLLH